MFIKSSDVCAVSLDWLLGRSEIRTAYYYREAALSQLLSEAIRSIKGCREEIEKINLDDKALGNDHKA